jgi:hypothetical protein
MNALARRSFPSQAVCGVLLAAAAAALCLLAASPAPAQTMTNTFGGFSKNSNEPIDIESDVLVVHDAQKYATFKGNVKAVQGTTTLRSRELDVHYVGSGSDSLAKGPDTTGSTPAPPPAQGMRNRAASGLAPTTAPRSARSRRGERSSSPATRTRPPRAIGRFTMCRPSS